MKKRFETRLKDLIKKLESYTEIDNLDQLKKAFWFAFKAHKDQKRRSGEPYFTHCLEATLILIEYKMDLTTLSACLLHDVVEDTGVTFEDIKVEFGEVIAKLVDGVTKISDLDYQKSETEEAENFRKLVLSMALDPRAIMIKFADRLHNMRTLEFMSKKKQVKIAQETQDIYAPLAIRFGIAKIGWQLEDLSLKYIDPKGYNYIEKMVAEKWEHRISHIHEIKVPVEKALEQLGVKCTIEAQPRSYNSMYRKLKKQEISFEGINDILAMKILVVKKEDCYRVLGEVHSRFTPVTARFKDFLASPKNNGYQSIHTTVHTPRNKTIEIQIRTVEMDRIALLGLTADWKYKTEDSNNEFDDQLGWVQQLIDWDSDNPDPTNFLQTLKFDLYKKEILVFTPNRKLINMPEGSSPVDFAFAVHSEIGLKCIGAKVNSRVVPLNFQLTSGDEVEIITSDSPNPQEYWLTFVTTAKAVSIIKKWINENTKQQQLALGQDMLSNELKKYKLTIDDISEDLISQKSGYSDIIMVLGAIGRHEISAEAILKRIRADLYKGYKDSLMKILPNILKRNEKESVVIKLQGNMSLIVELSTCCTPIPGDKIGGFIGENNKVIVHRVKCKSIPQFVEKGGKSVIARWGDSSQKTFRVNLEVTGVDRKHFLRDLANEISTFDLYIHAINIEVMEIVAVSRITMEVKDTEEFDKVVKKIEKVTGVQKVKRI